MRFLNSKPIQTFLLSIRKIKWQTWVLLTLILIGTFLRTYHFHDWLLFGDDQIRDASITSNVIDGKSPLPLIGPFMSYSGAGEHSEINSFHIGPIYYYFQIISAEIFGNSPDKLAYPDVFFAILSIPLLYIFLAVYFSKNISLGITALYTFSAYFISYSRFAWNTNLIPFFVLLFLLSLFHLLEKDARVPWKWVLSLGFAFGVGFQLHAIVMVLFSIVIFAVFVISMNRDPRIWKKWAVVLILFLGLNISQLVSESLSSFSNTKTFFSSLSNQENGARNSLSKLKNDIDCHIEASFYLLTSYGNGRCSHDFALGPSDGWKNHYFSDRNAYVRFTVLLTSLLFSVGGYFFLIFSWRKEQSSSKKSFLQLILFYFAIGFIIMLPLSRSDINEIRYFTFGFFIPYIFLGFFLKLITAKIERLLFVLPISAVIFGLLLYSNIYALKVATDTFASQSVTCSGLYKTTLGELEPVVRYMVSHSDDKKMIYIDKDTSHRVLPDALTYLLAQRGIRTVRLGDEDENSLTEDGARFYVSCKVPKAFPDNTVLKLDNTDFDQRIGKIHIFHLIESAANEGR